MAFCSTRANLQAGLRWAFYSTCKSRLSFGRVDIRLRANVKTAGEG